MDSLAAIGGIPSLAETKRMLRSKMEYLRARMDDIDHIQRADFSGCVHRSKKRKRGNDVCVWVGDGWKLLKIAENLLTQVDDCQGFLMCIKMGWVVDKFLNSLAIHDEKGDMFFMHPFSDRGGLHSGSPIPVKDLIGRQTLNTFVELEHLIHDTKVGRVAIHGREGIGKTFLMKHLHNSVLKWADRFAYVIWVSFPDELSIKRVQDAVAAALKCVFSSADDLNVRARELSKKLGDLGSYVLFLDGVPKADFSLDQIGIPVPAEGNESKLILTTCSNTLGCRMLDGFKTVELDRMSENEAFQLFIREAKIDRRSVTLLDHVPWLLTLKCHGIPRKIIDIASHKCGINDLCEWKNTLSELGNHEN